ncbi:MAG: 50S ribosomal protein L3 [Candidatus Aenigmatarchaeota archaeon]
MPAIKKPRRGSLQYWPRKRAKRIYPSVKWKTIEDAKPVGFASYKVGMTHVQYIKNNKPVVRAVTILEAPPLFVCGMRFYRKGENNNLNAFGEFWAEKLPKGIERKIGRHTPKNQFDFEKNKENVAEIRLIVCTQPTKSGMHKKKPELFELGLGNNPEKQYDYGKGLIGKELSIKDVFRPGEYCDVTSITKGYGFTGAVKRFGIKVQGRKDEQHHRHPGSIGSTTPRKVDWRVPMPGQYGFFQRTEYNKRILMIGDNPNKINKKAGFTGYGIVKGDYILLDGSVPGPRKRLVIISKPRRKAKYEPTEIKYISM